MTSIPPPPASPYRPDIDGLRAVAVLLVLVFHFQLVPGGKAGFIGVDVFFVISGFLITSIVKRQLDAGTFELSGFYLARIRRLAPALLAVLLMVMATGALLLFPADFVELSRQVFYSQVYLANIYFWKSVNYFGLGTDNVFLLHTWSLAVEEQFYLLYPLCLLLAHRFARRHLWLVIGLAGIASFGLNVAFVASKPEATFYLLPTRAWELLAGALVAAPAASWRRSRAVDELLGLLGAALIVVAVATYRTEIAFPGYFAILPVVGAACLLVCGQGSPLASRALSLSPVVYIGKISYPLYLVHWPLNVFASRSLAEDYGIHWRLTMFALSVLLAAALYHVVESPVRERRVLVAGRSLLRGYGAGITVTAALFVAVLASGGLPQRFPSEVNRLAGYANDKSPPLTKCEYAGTPVEILAKDCLIGQPGIPARWLVYGDSHAWAAHAAFDQWLRGKGEAGVFVYRNSCPPVMEVHVFGGRGECPAFNRSVIEFLAAHSEISHVALVSTWRQAAEARLSAARDLRLSPTQSIALFDDRFTQTLVRLHGMGKRIHIWEPVPGAARNVPLELARAKLEGRPPDLEMGIDRYLQENAFFFAALERNRHLVDVAFSPSEVLCSSGRCAATIEGRPAYFDNAHITRSTANFWVGVLQRGERGAPGVQPPPNKPTRAPAHP